MNKPLDRGLNAAVLHIASRLFPTGYDVRADMPEIGPGDLPKLRQTIADNGGRMVVWSGGSAHTIFGDEEVNWAFRAWHDWAHLKGNHDFTLEGERGALEMQQLQLVELYGTEKAFPWLRLLEAEVVGQAEHFITTGERVADQVAFDLEYVR